MRSTENSNKYKISLLTQTNIISAIQTQIPTYDCTRDNPIKSEGRTLHRANIHGEENYMGRLVYTRSISHYYYCESGFPTTVVYKSDDHLAGIVSKELIQLAVLSLFRSFQS